MTLAPITAGGRLWRKESLFRRRQMTMNDFKFNNVLETLNDLIISYSRARDTKRVDKRNPRRAAKCKVS
jgi:hypothetical protein